MLINPIEEECRGRRCTESPDKLQLGLTDGIEDVRVLIMKTLGSLMSCCCATSDRSGMREGGGVFGWRGLHWWWCGGVEVV